MLQTPPPDLPAISGVDIPGALARLAGNSKLLLKLFNEFHKQNKNILQEVRNTFDAQDYETVQRMLHTIKGVAANLAMNRIAEAAKAGEFAMREKNFDAYKAALPELEASLNEVCADIEAKVLVVSAPAPAAVPSGAAGLSLDESAKKAFAETIRLTARQNPDACFVFESVRNELASAYPKETAAIAEYLDNYAFMEALRELQKLAEALKLTQ